jgi:hypothetical protein
MRFSYSGLTKDAISGETRPAEWAHKRTNEKASWTFVFIIETSYLII